MSTTSIELPRHAAEQERMSGMPVAAIVLGIVNLVGAYIGLFNGVEPFATWFYQFAWLSVMLVIDGIIGFLLALMAHRMGGAAGCWSAATGQSAN